METEKKTNVWKWLFIAVVLGVGCAVGWELAFSKLKINTQTASTSAQMQTQEAAAVVVKPLKTEIVKRIKGNRHSMIYHLPGCASYSRIEDKNIVWFATNEEAEVAGFRMAKNC